MLELWLFLLSYVAHHGGNAVLLYKIQKKKSIDGICIDTQVMFLIGAVLRVIWVTDSKLYRLPILWLELPASIGIHSYILYLCHKYKDILYVETKKEYRWVVLVPLTLVLAFLFNPGDSWFSFQILVAASMFVESVALWPQLELLGRTVDASGMTKLYALCMAVGRAVRLLFWLVMIAMGLVFWQLLLADLLHLVLVWNFLRKNLSAVRGNKTFLLLSEKRRV